MVNETKFYIYLGDKFTDRLRIRFGMTSKEKTGKDISLSFDFLEYLVANPKVLEKIPDNSCITFLDNKNAVREKKKTPPHKKYVKVKREFEVL